MRYKRKPVDRDVVDAIFDKEKMSYIVQNADGTVSIVAGDTFDKEYEPVRRHRTTTAKTRKRKARTDPLPAG